MAFVKLDCGILDSSLWHEDAETRVVFLTMLALTEPTGLCPATAPGIASRAQLPLERVEIILAKLESPDKHSRSLEEEGRRIERVDGGYNIVNYLKYRAKRDPDERKEQVREAVARHRAKKKGVIPVSQGNPMKAQEEVEGDVEVEAEVEEKQKKDSSSPPVTEPAGFLDFWTVYPRKVGKGAARVRWKKINPDAALAERITLAVCAQRLWKSWEDVQFIPHPSTWLNEERWNDETTKGPPTSLNQRGDANADPLAVQRRDLEEAKRREDAMTPEQKEKIRKTLEDAASKFKRAT